MSVISRLSARKLLRPICGSVFGMNSQANASYVTTKVVGNEENVRSTAASGSQVYESKRAVAEYLLFHYGAKQDLAPFSDIPIDFALKFSERSANIGKNAVARNHGNHLRALDIGCAVGGFSFELSKSFQEVVGVDFSHHFINAANDLKATGEMNYSILKQGNIFYEEKAVIDSSIDRSKVSFYQGDACNLDPALGKFDLIVGSNLLCRLPDPAKFLAEIPNFLTEKGILLLISPYSWLEEYTSKSKWIGATMNSTNGAAVESFDVLKSILETNSSKPLVLEHRENIPFLIREHERKYQLGISDVTIWKQK